MDTTGNSCSISESEGICNALAEERDARSSAEEKKPGGWAHAFLRRQSSESLSSAQEKKGGKAGKATEKKEVVKISGLEHEEESEGGQSMNQRKSRDRLPR